MVREGSIIRVDFEAYTEDGELFDTTRHEAAEEHDHVHEEQSYEPMAVIVGTGRVVPGFDRALQEADVGEEVEVEIPPADGFGERDPEMIETLSLKEFERQDIDPYPGLPVQIRDRRGTVVRVTAGRVRVDFNAPLAGRTLTYKFTIQEVLEAPEDQVRAILDLDYGAGRGADFDVAVDGDLVTLTVPDRCKYDERWFVAKYRVVADIRNHTDLGVVEIVERYEPPAPPEPPAAEPEEGTADDEDADADEAEAPQAAE